MTIEETTEDLTKRLNRERAALRARVNELEQILGLWRSRLGLVGVDMDLGPESATDKLLDLLNASREVPRLLEKLSAYENQMVYQIKHCDRDNYDSPEAIVTLHGETICGCDSMEDAAKVAAALNRLPEKDN